MATTPTPNSTPTPLASSPAFQARAAEALGGAPTSPAMFQPIANSDGTAAARTPQASGAVAQPKASIFDIDADETKLRAKLDQVRSRTTGLVQALVSKTDSLAATLDDVADDKAFQEYASKQGFDLGKAQKLVKALEEAMKPVIK